MRDEKIIKSLECCLIRMSCDGCYYQSARVEHTCMAAMLNDVLDLIKRQQAEIESLKAEIEKYGEIKRYMKFEFILPIVREARNKAIKEFAERLKADAEWICDDSCIEQDLVEYIDNIVKEMTERESK